MKFQGRNRGKSLRNSPTLVQLIPSCRSCFFLLPRISNSWAAKSPATIRRPALTVFVTRRYFPNNFRTNFSRIGAGAGAIGGAGAARKLGPLLLDLMLVRRTRSNFIPGGKLRFTRRKEQKFADKDVVGVCCAPFVPVLLVTVRPSLCNSQDNGWR